MRPTWAQVDLGAIRENVRTFRSHLQRSTQLMAVVKADGYGHGAIPVAQAALEAGATWLGVAILEEAVQLRQAGITAPILILGWTPPEAAAELVRADVDQCVFSLEDAAAYGRAGRVRVHAKVDTGMSRLGFPVESAAAQVSRLAEIPGVELRGVFTHFAGSDEEDLAGTYRQLTAFRGVLERLRDRRLLVHAANTAAVLRVAESHFDLVRVGIGLYGYGVRAGLRPALTWHTRAAMVKRLPAGSGVSYNWTYRAPAPESVATLPVGYADGLPRALSNRGAVLFASGRASIRGRVCMDQTVVSTEGIPDVTPGAIATIIGETEAGSQWADELGAVISTIPYEILTRIGPRVPRVYAG